MKILHLGKFYPIKGGVEKVMYDIVEGVSKSAIQCDMLAASLDNKSHTYPVNAPYGKIECSATVKKMFSTMISPQMIIRLRKICNTYDIIHIHHPDPMAALALYLSGYKGKVILHWHSDILKQKKLLLLYSFLQKWLIERSEYIIGTSPVYTRDSDFLRNYQHKVITIPIGIEKVSYDESKVEEIKKQYPGKKIIFSLGRLVDYKGYEYLIKAASYLSGEYIILIGGSGPNKEKLQQLIDEKQLTDKVKLLGRVTDEDLPHYYGACDIFCLSSIFKTEAFAIVQVEAMSCSKPVVATWIEGSGVSWVNKHEYSGINVDTRNEKQLAEAIQYLLDEPERYKMFSENAFKRFNEVFLKEKMIKSCIKLYNELV